MASEDSYFAFDDALAIALVSKTSMMETAFMELLTRRIFEQVGSDLLSTVQCCRAASIGYSAQSSPCLQAWMKILPKLPNIVNLPDDHLSQAWTATI